MRTSFPILRLLMCVAVSFFLMPNSLMADKKKGKRSSKKSAVEKSSRKDKGEKGEKTPVVRVEKGKGGKKVYRITTGFVIEGRIQKPNAFYVLQRSQINYDWSELVKDFTPRIIEALKHQPF